MLLLIPSISLAETQGTIGTTSTGSLTISITIPPRLELKLDKNGQPIIDTNLDLSNYIAVETYDPLTNTKTIIYEPKL